MIPDMTERKPAGASVETWIDAQIRDAQERGAFENLPGTGKPIPDLDQPYDPNRWIKQKIRAEGLPTEALLPAVIATKRLRQMMLEGVAHTPGYRTGTDISDHEVPDAT